MANREFIPKPGGCWHKGTLERFQPCWEKGHILAITQVIWNKFSFAWTFAMAPCRKCSLLDQSVDFMKRHTAFHVVWLWFCACASCVGYCLDSCWPPVPASGFDLTQVVRLSINFHSLLHLAVDYLAQHVLLSEKFVIRIVLGGLFLIFHLHLLEVSRLILIKPFLLFCL